MSNYRGITILSAILPSCSNCWYTGSCTKDLRCCLADCQHDFVKDKSIFSNLLEYFSFVFKSIEDGC
jgi:hypothetical protein